MTACTGSRAVLHIKRFIYPEAKGFHVCIPPVREQRRIARILGALDDKIELNRRMNETLEAMARALFKSWFVDFDPIRTKLEGWGHRLPGRSFPTSLPKSKAGEIPDGLHVARLSEISRLNPEVWSNATRPETIKYLDLSNTKWGRVEAIACYERQSAPSRAQRVLRAGDTIVGTVRPGNGSFALISEDGLTGSTGFAVLRPHRTEYTEFLYLAATSPENIDALSHLADGGAYPAVRPEMVAATQAVIGDDDVMRCFSAAARPLLAKLALNERQNQIDATLRDALLPKLISGELRLNDLPSAGNEVAK